MRVKILFFGMAKDLTGETSATLELNEEMKVSALRRVLQEKYPLFSQMDSFSIAVNESYAEEDLIIVENDTVAVIPPVSGG
jgi:molybdopterin converting factor subunit 1